MRLHVIFAVPPIHPNAAGSIFLQEEKKDVLSRLTFFFSSPFSSLPPPLSLFLSRVFFRDTQLTRYVCCARDFVESPLCLIIFLDVRNPHRAFLSLSPFFFFLPSFRSAGGEKAQTESCTAWHAPLSQPQAPKKDLIGSRGIMGQSLNLDPSRCSPVVNKLFAYSHLIDFK